MGAVLLKHYYSSPFTTSTPAGQSLGNFFLFFYGPFVIPWAYFDFPSMWRRL